MVGQWEEVREEIRDIKRYRKGNDQKAAMTENLDWIGFIEVQEDLNT